MKFEQFNQQYSIKISDFLKEHSQEVYMATELCQILNLTDSPQKIRFWLDKNFPSFFYNNKKYYGLPKIIKKFKLRIKEMSDEIK